jgi:glycosidase
MKIFHDLISCDPLQKLKSYGIMLEAGNDFFDRSPRFGPEGESLLEMISAPARISPDSIAGQLEYIKDRWPDLIGPFHTRLLRALDLLKEEEKRAGGGKGPAHVISISDQPWWSDAERFSPDSDWMPLVVLLAKNVTVWLDQLSKTYGRDITTLDRIPDAELDAISSRGFTGLWLIGLWERSPASRKIKNMCGNPEAMASAYAVAEYRIAGDLGGEEALENLKKRAAGRNIRLASDMVPNHMGLDSPWVINHPEHFIHLDHPPFPGYTYTGADLSNDERVAIHIEDHYYDRTDAAVVFKWADRRSGRTRFIYHGNDGTSMPWNDTAQLNHLLPEVRERLIQTILSVARRFSIIRFDAAMTLTKKHFQRLWYPEPGHGGDIPSRSAHGLEHSNFQKMMPEEFWRQVVDRAAAEAPDTLLLAEAFWLMEPFFVRNLGMHRVYNSAFMNFLRDEQNQEFRESIKNVLSFNPEILKRFVNFMNNPDEETAVSQFGRDDKYFGICTLMVTLPGLPMFGHGQVEGFEEKYGMEYRRAYRGESPDAALVARHEREIFPLMRRRHQFAHVEAFRLYDFRTGEGRTCEDVIAFSNRRGRDASLVLYHNRYAACRGWIRHSSPFGISDGAQGGKNLRQEDVVRALGFTPADDVYIRFRDHVSGLEFIRHSREMESRGLFFELEAYRTHVFLDFTAVQDYPSGIYGRLCASLKGQGVDSLDEVLRKHYRNPLFRPLQDVLQPSVIGAISDGPALESRTSGGPPPSRFERLLELYPPLLSKTWEITGWRGDPAGTLRTLTHDLRGHLSLWEVSPLSENLPQFLRREVLDPLKTDRRLFLMWTLLRRLDPNPPPPKIWDMVEHWALSEPIQAALHPPETGVVDKERKLTLLQTLLHCAGWWIRVRGNEENWVSDLMALKPVSAFMGIHVHEGRLWFHRESAERLIRALIIIALQDVLVQARAGEAAPEVKRIGTTARDWLRAVP